MTLEDPWPEPWRRLMAAALIQGVKDASRALQWREIYGPGSPAEARRWLRSAQARRIADELDLGEALERWLARGSPVKPHAGGGRRRG